MKRSNLEATLARAKNFLMRGDFIPALMEFKFHDKKVTAYNDEQGVQINLDTGLECTVPGQLMIKMLSTISSEEVMLTRINNKGSSIVQLKAGRSKIKLPSKDLEDYPFEMPEIEGLPITVGEQFLDGLKHCLISATNDPTHHELNGVTLIIEDGIVAMYATDNRTLSAFEYEQKDISDNGSKIVSIIPIMFCEQLIELAGTYFDGVPSVDLYVNSDKVIATVTNSCTLFTRTIDPNKARDFPTTVNRIIGDISEVQSGMVPTEIVPALERAAMLKPNSDQEIFTTFSVKKSSVVMTTESALGKVQDDMEFDEQVDWGEFDFEVNPALVARGFKMATHVAHYPGQDGAFVHIISHRQAKG